MQRDAFRFLEGMVVRSKQEWEEAQEQKWKEEQKQGQKISRDKCFKTENHNKKVIR